MPDWATEPITDALPRLLKQRRMSLRGLADLVGVDVSHLSRVLGGDKPIRLSLLEEIAGVLDVPADYFVEIRERRLTDHIAGDGDLRDRLYELLIIQRRSVGRAGSAAPAKRKGRS